VIQENGYGDGRIGFNHFDPIVDTERPVASGGRVRQTSFQSLRSDSGY